MDDANIYASFDGRTYFQEDLAERLKEIYVYYRNNDYTSYLDVTDYIIGKTNYFLTKEEREELELIRGEISLSGRKLNAIEDNERINPKERKHQVARLNTQIKELMREHQKTLNTSLHNHNLLIGGGQDEIISDELLL